MNDKGGRSTLAILGLVALPLLCCGLPALVAAGALAATGGWLTTHGSWLGGGIVLAAASAVGVRWWARRRRCELTQPASRVVGGR